MSHQEFRHHFIPEFYQRGFIADGTGLIWVYQKGSEPRQKSVRKTAMELNFYAYTKGDRKVEAEAVERELAKLDSDGARVIHTLEDNRLLTEQERKILARFVSVMWRRTPKHKKQAEMMAADMMEKFFEDRNENWLLKRIRERVQSDEQAQRLFEEQAPELAKIRDAYLKKVPNFLFPTNTLRDSMFESVLLAMDWAYFRATKDTEFLTCDDPVIFNKGTGLKDTNAVIIFPLSRTLLLQAMWISEYRNRFHRLSDVQIRTFNRYVVQNAHKQIYASKRSETLKRFVGKWIGRFEKNDS